MSILELLWYFLAGAFGINAVPHLVKGITGQTHMTPFKRVSGPVLNVVWGFTSAVLALYLLGLASGKGGFVIPSEAGLQGMNLWAAATGAFVNAAYLAYFWSNPKARLPWHKD